MKPIRVMVVDDHEIVREGLIKLIQNKGKDIRVLANAANGSDALAKAEFQELDVVLMDLRMPEMDGVTAIRELKKRFPNLKLIVLTTFNDDDLILEAFQAGAVAYLLKDTPSVELVQAIRAAHAGRTMMSPGIQEKLIQMMARPSQVNTKASRPTSNDSPEQLLAPRELEVLRLIGQGYDNHEIARRLLISEGTVKNYVSRIYEQLGFRNRGQAIVYAIEKGLTQ